MGTRSNEKIIQRKNYIKNNKKSKLNNSKYRNPIPTVDVIIEMGDDKILLIRRKNKPYGWALPGGFVEYGETLEEAAVREIKEETSLDIQLIEQFHTYSAPNRDPRFHTISTVYIARPQKATEKPSPRDDAEKIGLFSIYNLPQDLAFDHKEILSDYINYIKNR